ncbi:MAG: hypothetical protein SCH71_04945 [Desulfobulbaceae bacterium]|nr:hypothetical protein [Desulfobulbaceae bacterium]
MNSHDETEVTRVLAGINNYEKTLYEIYNSFAIIFSEYKTFWHDIAVEENTHSMMVEVFISLYNEGDISFSGRNFQLAEIESEVEKLRSFQNEMKERQISINEAVEFSLTAEKSIIEREIFKIKDSDPPEFKKLLKELLKGFNKHYSTIYKFYRNIKK